MTPRWVRALAIVIPRRYRDDVVADLLDECARQQARGRPRARTSLWLAAELLRSARASRRRPAHEQRSGDLMLTALWLDVRYAVRYFRQRPAFTGVAVATLTLGIGVNLAAFAVLNATLLRPLPFSDPDRIVRIWEGDKDLLTPADFVAMRDGTREVFVSFAAWLNWGRATLTGRGDPMIVPMVDATPELFEVMGVPPAAGRVLTTDDVADRASVIVISHRLWQTRFQSDPNVIGTTATIDGKPWTIVGRMPEGVGMPDTDAWRPLGFTPQVLAQTHVQYLNSVARLRPGVTLLQTDAAIKVVMAAIPRAKGDERTATAENFHRSSTDVIRSQLVFAQSATGFVLLIACANLANLLLGSFTARRDEIAVRLALGASRARVVRQLIVESLLLSAIGGALAIVVASWLAPAIVAAYPGALPRRAEIGVRAVEWLVALATAAATAIACTVLPALVASRSSLSGAARGTNRTTTGGAARWLRPSLIVAEVALALMLLTGAGLLVRSLAGLVDQPLGFDPDGIVTADFTLPPTPYSTMASRAAFFTALCARLNALASVERAGGSMIVPFDGNEMTMTFVGDAAGGESARMPVSVRIITPEYFEVMRLTLKRGRALTTTDIATSPAVVVVNEAFVRKYAADRDLDSVRTRQTPTSPWLAIVGVVSDVRPSYEREAQPEMYFPITQMPTNLLRLTIRPRGTAASFGSEFRRTVAELDANLATPPLQAYDELMDLSVGIKRFNRTLLTAMAALAATLAAVGIYGVMSYVVVLRRREVGVRLALGARPAQVVALVVRQGLVPVIAGLTLGLGGAWMLTTLLESQLYRITPHDPWTMAAATMLFFVVGLLACWIPARRSSRVDPVTVLRAD